MAMPFLNEETNHWLKNTDQTYDISTGEKRERRTKVGKMGGIWALSAKENSKVQDITVKLLICAILQTHV